FYTNFLCFIFFFFFFQAEDGIRDFHVTGVQTCALPILSLRTEVFTGFPKQFTKTSPPVELQSGLKWQCRNHHSMGMGLRTYFVRSEERRVGKECRSWSMT